MSNLAGLFITFLVVSTHAQIVETVVSHPDVGDGMCVDAAGNVYTTSGGLSGTVLGKYAPGTDTFYPSAVTGLVGPTDVEFLNDSILVITNYDIDAISAYNFNTGILSTIGSGDNFDGPGGIETDEEGYVYITNWGNAPEYAGHTITKISPSGESWIYIDSDLLYRPQAITFNHEDQLVVHSNEKLYKINEADSTLVFWTDLGAGVPNIVFNPEDSCIYGTAIGEHKILKVDVEGNVSFIAGIVAGYEDGDIENAKFQNPLGLTFSPGGDTLYISEGGGVQRLRRILLAQFTGWEEFEIIDQLKLYPNPVVDGQDLHIAQLVQPGDELYLYAANGQLLRVVTFSEVNQNIISASVLNDKKPGTYILTLNRKNGNQSACKVIVK